MALGYTRFSFLIWMLPLVLLSACNSHKKVYTSNCDQNIVFIHVDYAHLMDSLKYYDQKYVEVSGRYTSGKEQSALFSDSLYIIQPAKAFWVNFSTDCPLYLSGTHIGFFDLDEGGFTKINDKKIKIRGKIDLHNRGYQKQYKGCIDHVSFIEL